MRLKLITISISVILAGFCATSIAQAQTVPFFGEAKDICELIKNIFYFGVSLAGIAAVLVIMIGGIIYMVSFGSEEKKKTAMDLMGGALKGLLLALFSWTIFYIINPYILRCKVPVLEVEIPEYITTTYNPCIGQYVYEKKEKCDPVCQAQDFGECIKGNTAGCKVSEAAVSPSCFNDNDCPYGYGNCTYTEGPISGYCQVTDVSVPVKTPPLEGYCCLPKGILTCPVVGPLTSCFGPRCVSAPGSLYHPGIDIACTVNTPIVAAADGKVYQCYSYTYSGNTEYAVGIEHTKEAYGGVSRTRYIHLIEHKVSVGDTVEGGKTIIGLSGCIGAPHLHFEVYVDSPPNLTDPRPYLTEACFTSVCPPLGHCCSCDNYEEGNCCPSSIRCHGDAKITCP